MQQIRWFVGLIAIACRGRPGYGADTHRNHTGLDNG